MNLLVLIKQVFDTGENINESDFLYLCDHLGTYAKPNHHWKQVSLMPDDDE